MSLDSFGCFGLTEKNIGSDANNMETYVTKTKGGFKLNGNKRWIGNGNGDFMVVFA